METRTHENPQFLEADIQCARAQGWRLVRRSILREDGRTLHQGCFRRTFPKYVADVWHGLNWKLFGETRIFIWWVAGALLVCVTWAAGLFCGLVWLATTIIKHTH